MDSVKAYWWRGENARVSNFGDAIAPLILRRFAGLTSSWDTISHSSVIVTGSILEHVPPLWDGNIIGAGRLYEDSYLHLHYNTAKVWAVRGPYSAHAIPASQDYALGDPGLLADEMVYVHNRDIDIGIVPHLTDPALAHQPEWFSDKWTTSIIDVRDNPLDVIRQIGRCKKIVTSSLHGLVTADAFGIPRRFELNPAAGKYEGGLYKYLDYSASIGMKFEPGKLIEASRFRVEDRKHQLWDAFRAYGDHVRAS